MGRAYETLLSLLPAGMLHLLLLLQIVAKMCQIDRTDTRARVGRFKAKLCLPYLIDPYARAGLVDP
jgi:hypothetical protein